MADSQEPGATKKTLIATAVLLLAFGTLAAFMPRIMLALGETSPWIALVAAALFVVLPFAVLAGRARYQKRKEKR